MTGRSIAELASLSPPDKGCHCARAQASRQGVYGSMISLRLRSGRFEAELPTIDWLLSHNPHLAMPRLESVDRLTSTESPDIKAVQKGEPGMRSWQSTLLQPTDEAVVIGAVLRPLSLAS